MRQSFEKESDIGPVLFTWWSELQNNTGARAELRRCKDPAAVCFIPEFHRACHALQPLLRHEHEWQSRLALVVGALSHVTQVDTSCKFSEQMARPKNSGPAVSELRFRRLLERDREELYAPMIRVLRMLNGSANLYDLSESLFYWSDTTRKKWAYEYFQSTVN